MGSVSNQPLLCETRSYHWFFLILLINLRYFTKIIQKCYCWQTLIFACQTQPLYSTVSWKLLLTTVNIIFVTFAEQGDTFSNHHYRYIKFRLTSIYEFSYAYTLFVLIRYYLFVSGCRPTSCNIRIYFGCALEERCKTPILCSFSWQNKFTKIGSILRY